MEEREMNDGGPVLDVIVHTQQFHCDLEPCASLAGGMSPSARQ
jgi:hypothetical protein